MNDLRYSAADVRAELYDIWNELQYEWNDHLFEHRAGDGKPHPLPCRVCERYAGRQQAIMRAVLRFGGRNRRSE